MKKLVLFASVVFMMSVASCGNSGNKAEATQEAQDTLTISEKNEIMEVYGDSSAVCCDTIGVDTIGVN